MTAAARALPTLLPPSSETNVINRVLAVAASQINYREGKSSSGYWNNDTIYGSWYGMNYNPWCEMFTAWAAFMASIPQTVIPKMAYTPYGLRFFKNQGRVVSTPQRGDLFFVVNSSGLAHHVGFVEKVLSGGRIQTIEGNTNTNGSDQGDGVYRLTRPIKPSTGSLAFCRPNYAACVTAKPTIATKALVLAAAGSPMNTTDTYYADARAFLAWGRALGAVPVSVEVEWAAKHSQKPRNAELFGVAVKAVQKHFGLTQGALNTTTILKMKPYGYTVVAYDGKAL